MMRVTSTVSVLTLLSMPCCGQDTSRTESISAPWLPYDAHELVAGRSLTDWAIEWNRWSFAQTDCVSALTDNDGSHCGLYQDPDSPVFFLSFAPSKRVRTKCEVPKGKPILVPLGTAYSNNVEEDPPLPDEELEGYVADALAAMRDVTLIVDAQRIPVGPERVIGPVAHTVMLPPTPNFYACEEIEGYDNVLLDPVFLAGYFALLPPAPVGEHSLSYSAALQTFGVSYAQLGNLRFKVDGP